MTSTRILWATDVHLDAAEQSVVDAFCDAVNAESASALLLSGDIGEGASLEGWLAFLTDRVCLPIYYVLGNHDYYGSSIGEVRRRARDRDTSRLRWLPHAGVVHLAEDVALVGHDGWGDARLGNFLESYVLFNDYLCIKDLSRHFDMEAYDGDLRGQERLKTALEALGDDAADTLRPILRQAVQQARRVIVLTHVPPFREAAWYRGELSDDLWLHGITCKAMGDLLRETAEANPGCAMTVLCGHTHGTGVADILPNLRVYTGEARCGRVQFKRVDMTGGDVVVGSRALPSP